MHAVAEPVASFERKKDALARDDRVGVSPAELGGDDERGLIRVACLTDPRGHVGRDGREALAEGACGVRGDLREVRERVAKVGPR